MQLKKILAIVALCGAAQSWAVNTTGWTCSNATGCGALTADGVVTNAPVTGTTGYAWVSTEGASTFLAADLPAGVPAASVTNGSTFTSPSFTVSAANTPIGFHFNYVTSDGGTFSDFAWARLLDGAGNEVALLFTARTPPDLVTAVVPGNGMPPPQATLNPPSAPIIGGAPNWTPLGGDSGSCYSTGCGYSGWVEASYTIASPGIYRLEIGVVNWSDTQYQSGLAVDGLLVAGHSPFGPVSQVTPVPTLNLWGLGMLGVLLTAVAARRRARRS